MFSKLLLPFHEAQFLGVPIAALKLSIATIAPSIKTLHVGY